MGKVNFLKIFIAAFGEIVKYMTNMLGKVQEIRWKPEARQSFEGINRSIVEAPVLTSPDFSKYFLIFSFSSKHAVVGVLLQKNHEGFEHPITFYNKTLRDASLKYNSLDKKTYTLAQALKDFRVYILHSHVIAHAHQSCERHSDSTGSGGTKGEMD